MLQDQLSGELMEQASSFLGESTANTSSAMGAALPSILGSLISKGSTQSGASGIMDMITKGGFDGSMLSNIGSMLGGGDATSGLINSGSGILSSLMGNKLGGVVDLIASVSGMKKSSSSSLLSMAAPMLMSLIGKQVMGKGVSGLMDLLSSQKEHVSSAMPAGMGSLLGLGNLGDNVSETVSAAADTAKSSGGGLLKWLLIGLAALAALWYFGLRTGCDAVDGAADKVGETTSGLVEGATDVAGKAGEMVKDGAEAAGDMVKDGAEAVGDAAGAVVDGAADLANKALEGITFAAGSVGAKMKDLFASGEDIVGQSIAFSNMKFPTGSAAIDAGSMDEVNNLAALLKAYPKYNVEVGGHTDNTGQADANMALSKARAESVKTALVAAGVSADRISAKGYGSTMPTASNDTKEGQAANRRIEVTITK